jgi:hypothetical protein
MRKKADKVLILNIKNGGIDDLFNELREEYHESIPRSPHITIYGPYKCLKNEIIEKTKDIINNISIEIDDIDIFEFNEQFFCVFKVKAPRLEEIWKKPDFPQKKYGFNPHITLYRGNKETAITIKKKVKSIKNIFNLSIMSNEIEIKKSIIGQRELPLDLRQ